MRTDRRAITISRGKPGATESLDQIGRVGGFGVIVFEVLGLLVLQPYSVLKTNLIETYSTGGIFWQSSVVVAVGVLISIFIAILVGNASERSLSRTDARATSSMGMRCWATINYWALALGLIVLVFAFAGVALSFVYLGIDEYSPIGRGPFWLSLGNLFAGPVVLACAVVSIGIRAAFRYHRRIRD